MHSAIMRLADFGGTLLCIRNELVDIQFSDMFCINIHIVEGCLGHAFHFLYLAHGNKTA